MFEIEHIDDPCQVTIAVNPKEYIELFESDTITKKHEGVHKGEDSMNLYSFGKRINSVKEIEIFGQLEKDTVNQSSQASKCIVLSFFCKFGYQNETFRNYYLALKKHKNGRRQKLVPQIGKIGLHFGKSFLRSKNPIFENLCKFHTTLKAILIRTTLIKRILIRN